MYNIKCVISILLLHEILYTVFAASQSSSSTEYCSLESFEPSCGDNEVIIMTHAKYGRMKLGRCVDRDFGFLGCAADVLAITDETCSGKKECHIQLPNNVMTNAVDCLHRSLSPYLDASYKCQEVAESQSNKCIAPKKIKVEKTSTYLASKTSKQSSCGLHDSPWILEAKAGQKIELNMFDFAWKETDNDTRHNTCPVNYGYILDLVSDDVISICGGGKRKKLLYSSVGNSVQIMLEKTAVDMYNFLLKFQAFGCPDYKPPEYSWVQKENDSLVIGCESSSEKWRVKCVDNMWLGMVGNCTPSPKSEVVVKQSEDVTEKIDAFGMDQAQIPSISNNHVIVFTLGCVTLLICCSVILLGIYCTKRYDMKLQKYKYPPTLSYKDSRMMTLSSVHSTNYRPVSTLLQANHFNPPAYTFPGPHKDNSTSGPGVPPRNASFKAIQSNIPEDNTFYENTTGEEQESAHYHVLEDPINIEHNNLPAHIKQNGNLLV